MPVPCLGQGHTLCASAVLTVLSHRVQQQWHGLGWTEVGAIPESSWIFILQGAAPGKGREGSKDLTSAMARCEPMLHWLPVLGVSPTGARATAATATAQSPEFASDALPEASSHLFQSHQDAEKVSNPPRCEEMGL
jgi:hypothetical protein